MLARILALSLGLGLVLLVAPTPGAPVEQASAYCIDLGEFGCVDPCNGVVGAYNEARRETGTEDVGPDPYCLD